MSDMDRLCLGGPYGLIAEIIQGDNEEPDRIWVCVRHPASPDGAWLGCWSKPSTVRDDQAVGEILQSLMRIAELGTSMGPRGPVFGEHYFFTGWQTWGPGAPAPLMELE
ncbi:hypothetical protein AB0M41_25690 [Streptomyces sp. NPDC051896]|uniref:hypothetical protein n=1 Tax=Streptomyces sp. NPDC051896 TaxID=3155416 RepID=UPI003449B469